MIKKQDGRENQLLLSRRNFIGGMAALAGLSVIPKPVLAAIPKARTGALAKPARFLAFNNLHTGEATKLVYWEKGRYIKGALSEINHVLRDHRTGDVARIDPALLDQLFVLHNKLESRTPFQVISGYRSPKSNAMLREHSKGVARHSMHTEGRAIDIRLQDARLINVRNAALAMNAGGVGYYPESQFVHVDTGRVRHW
jgi:uncharacterized protein YcbK (DUF882 family)